MLVYFYFINKLYYNGNLLYFNGSINNEFVKSVLYN